MGTNESLIYQLIVSPDPSSAFKKLVADDFETAKQLFESVGGSRKLAAELGYVGDQLNSKARKFRKLVRTPDKTNPDRFKQEIASDSQQIQTDIAKILQKNRERPYTISELSELVDRGPSTVKVALEALREQGIGIHAVDGNAVTIPLVAQRQHEDLEIDFRGDAITFGVISDTHYGSKHAAEDMAQAAYDYYESEGIDVVLNCGDMTEGPGERGYKGHANDVWTDCQRWDGLEQYASDNYPRRDGVTTYLISSSKSHDGWEWNASGRDICADIVNGRKAVYGSSGSLRWGDEKETLVSGLEPREDMMYLGHDSADVLMGPEKNVRVRMFHPDGGSAYSCAYNPQKFVEAMPGGSKPHVFLIGHYHTFFHARFRNVNVVCVPGCQWMTPLFRRYGKEPVVGALVCTVHVDGQGSVRSVDVKDLCHYYQPEGAYNR